MPDAADETQLARLSRLTHLDLGWSRVVAALAPLLPDLQSLGLNIMGKNQKARGSAISC
jgi:hypothetical protein